MTGRTTAPRGAHQAVHQAVHQAASLLLDHPDDTWPERRRQVADAPARLPGGAPALLLGFCRWAAGVPPLDLAARYVTTFDRSRRCRATSRSDRPTLPLLALVLLAGPTATASSVTDPYDYRLGVAVWFRSLFTLDPDIAAMAHAPLVHQCHALLALALFALWPFGRLVHAFAVPLGYLTRPYVVYRSRGGAAPAGRGAAPARRGVGVR